MAPSSRGLGPRTTVWALQSLPRALRAPAGPGRCGTGHQGAVGTTQLPMNSSAGWAETGWQPSVSDSPVEWHLLCTLLPHCLNCKSSYLE